MIRRVKIKNRQRFFLLDFTLIFNEKFQKITKFTEQPFEILNLINFKFRIDIKIPNLKQNVIFKKNTKNFPMKILFL